MINLLSKLTEPYFDFLVFPAGQCWESHQCVKTECFHHPDGHGVHDVIVSVFLQAFEQSHQDFMYFGPTEYTSDKLHHLGQLLRREVDAISSCRTPKQFRAKLPVYFTSDCDDFLGLWLPKWRKVRNELATYGLNILHLVEQAEREEKALLVLGI